jgi:hypothetical protein
LIKVYSIERRSSIYVNSIERKVARARWLAGDNGKVERMTWVTTSPVAVFLTGSGFSPAGFSVEIKGVGLRVQDSGFRVWG